MCVRPRGYTVRQTPPTYFEQESSRLEEEYETAHPTIALGRAGMTRLHWALTSLIMPCRA